LAVVAGMKKLNDHAEPKKVKLIFQYTFLVELSEGVWFINSVD